MSASEKIARMSTTDMESLNADQIEKLLNAYDHERVQSKEQAVRMRAVLNKKLRQQHIKDRFGEHVYKMIEKMEPEEVNEMLREAAKDLAQREQVIKVEPIELGLKVKRVGVK